ncbi:MAG: Uncharacterised protein [Flavobacteriia bacterium]|nr:MAG: Uncharacterised protein [Flavobacteriia bacterium]
MDLCLDHVPPGARFFRQSFCGGHGLICTCSNDAPLYCDALSGEDLFALVFV